MLGLPLLHLHNPSIDWQTSHTKFWSPKCFTDCARIISHLNVTTVESPNSQSRIHILSEYFALKEVFSPTRQVSLPPHRPWNCVIDLLPGTVPPRSKVYPLSLARTKAMEEYVEEALRQWLIHVASIRLVL